jgi:gas vesicle protein
VGAVVGAGVALLLAPKSGKETREWLGAKSSQVKGRLAEAVERTKAAVRHEAQVIASTLETPRH